VVGRANRPGSARIGAVSTERIDPDPTADERNALRQWLDYHRATLVMKASGLDDAQVRVTVTPSGMSLLGLVRHMADVERNWFRRTFIGESAPPIYYGESHPTGDPDGDFNHGPDDTVDEALATYLRECERSREIEAAAPTLDQMAVREDRQVDLRWIMLHMIEETARHNGHADLLREAADGSTGD